MARFLIVGGFFATLFWIFSIIDCALQPRTRHRGVSKGWWIAIVAALPVIGGILWFTIGRRPKNGTSVRLTAPEGDPEFLTRLEREEQDARIARLEEELRRLDDESDSPDTRT